MATADDPQAPAVSPTPDAAAPTPVDGAPPAAADGAAPVPADAAAVPSAADDVLLDRLDNVLVGLVLLFAFVLALFPAKNSDFLQQLAAGQLVARGQYHFGADPFTLTGEKTGWINHSWLFGLFAYLIYQLPGIGPSAVVVLKALLVAGMAGLMLLAGQRPGQRRYVPAVITALAVLALSPRLLLQPVVVSYVFLALTLWLLDRPRRLHEQGGPAEAPPTAWWFLPPLFAVWVNVDQWFFLGPLVVALYLAGELIQKDREARLGILGAVLAASVVACLLNPYHVHAFTLPAQLSFSEGMDALKEEGGFRALGVTPLQSLYFNPALGLNTAGIAYFPLAILGAVSFGLTWGVTPWWRLTVWLGFLLLSLVHARAIAFFAVVAGPITAMNFLEYMAMQAAQPDAVTMQRHRIALAGRMVALVFGVIFLAAGALGLLQANPQEDRRIGAGVVVDPLLQKVAEEIRRRQNEGDAATAMDCFNTAPEIVHYLSWFSPGVRGFMDARLPQFPEAARAFVAAKKALTAEQDSVIPGLALAAEPAYRPIFREWGVGYFLLHDQDPLRQVSLLQRFLANPEEWPPLAVVGEGRTMVLGWHDPQAGRAVRTTNLSEKLQKAAFGPGVEPFRPNPAGEPLAASSWWNVLLQGEPPRSPYSAAAANYFALFQASMPGYQAKAVRSLEAFSSASLVAGAGVGAGPIGNGTYGRWLTFFSSLGQEYLGNKDEGPPAALYLALRAARRALAENPNDARTHMILGEAYFDLGRHTRERALASPYLMNLRQGQAIACFQQALTLDPELPLAQRRLAELLGGQFIDLQVKYFTMLVKQLAASDQQADRDQAKALEADLEEPRTTLKRRQDQYELESVARHPVEKARTALRIGLAEKALEELQKFLREEQEKASMNQGVAIAMEMAVYLLFATGRVAEARELLNSPAKNSLGNLLPDLQVPVPAYAWYMLMLAAIVGDADEVDNYAAEIQARTVDPGRPMLPVAVGQYLLNEALLAGVTPYSFERLSGSHPRMIGQVVQQARAMLEKEASLRLLRGVAFLEAGELKRAREELQRALVLSSGPEPPKGQVRVPIDRRARDMAGMYLEWLDTE